MKLAIASLLGGGYRSDFMKIVSLSVIISVFGYSATIGAQELPTSKLVHCSVIIPVDQQHHPGDIQGSNTVYTADEFSLTEGILYFSGNVRVRDKLRTIYSDHIEFDRKSRVFEATGDVSVFESDARYEGRNIRVDSTENALSGEDIEFVLYSPETTANDGRLIVIRGDAGELQVADGVWDVARSAFTNCPEGVDDVVIIASELDLDTDARQGKARNVILKVKKIPIGYTPFIGFPLGTERLSGFLFPSLSYSSGNGTIIAVPYYFSLAPNYDATISANVQAKRGFQFEGEFRHLGVNSDTKLRGEIMPSDSRYQNSDSRYAAEVKSNWFDGRRLYTSLNTGWVSDRSYNEDFSGFFPPGPGDDYVRQNVEAGIFGDRFKASVGMNGYVIADAAIKDTDSTHEKKPWASYEHLFPLGKNWNLDMGLYTARFRHLNKLSATRYSTDTAIEYVYRRDYGVFEMRVGGEWVDYRNFTNVPEEGPYINSDGSPPKYSVFSSYYEFDGRLFFDREVRSENQQQVWTFEPRVKFVSAPKKNQHHLPVFDSEIRSIDVYEDLFHSSPYVGGDRVRDVEQVSAGVSFSLNSGMGYQSIRRFGIGRIFYTDNRQPSMDGKDPEKASILSGKGKSDIFLGLSYIEPLWQVDFGMLYDDATRSSNKIDQTTTRVSRDLGGGARISGLYRFKRDDGEQVGLLSSFPLNSGWKAKFSIAESLSDHKLTRANLQFDYVSCCLNAGFKLTRELNDNGKLENSFRMFLKIEGFDII